MSGSASRTRNSGPSKQERVYQGIRQRIVRGDIGPGTRLVMDALSREYGVSTVPVREAVRRLEAEGWVTFTRNVGAQVAPLDRDRWISTTDALGTVTAAATAMALPFITPADLAEARRCNERFAEAIETENPLNGSEANRALHLALARPCPNQVLMEMMRDLWDRLDATRSSVFIFIPSRSRAAVEEHTSLIDEIEAGASEEVVLVDLRRHMRRTVGALLVQIGAVEPSEDSPWDVTSEQIGAYLLRDGAGRPRRRRIGA